jgi:hypothetical protein
VKERNKKERKRDCERKEQKGKKQELCKKGTKRKEKANVRETKQKGKKKGM